MKIGGTRQAQYLRTQRLKRVRLHGNLVELQRAAEEIEFELRSGYLPHGWASLLIARFARRDASRLAAAGVDVR